MKQSNWHSLFDRRVYLFLLAAGGFSNAFAGFVENGNFETQPIDTHWFVSGAEGTLLSSTADKHEGTYSALIENRAQDYVGPGQDLKGKLEAGVNYTISAWVKPKNAPEGVERFKLGISQEDGNGKQYLEIDSVPLRSHSWTKLSGPFTLSTKGSLKVLNLYVYNENKSMDFYVDDVQITAPVAYTPTPAGPKDFIRAKGRDLVVGSNEQVVRLLGVNFIAYDDDDSEPAEKIFRSKNYDEIDYKRVADMGMNVVRLTMTYTVFEDNSNPGKYKQEGWEWLEKNIVWARKYGVALILDMHVPPGGYQSWGYSGPFWGSNNKYRTRLNNLWKAIAKRYKDEPFVAAYDLINEPSPKNNKQWENYTQELVDEIRTVDKNHLIIVEEAFTDDTAPFILNDDNIMYDFHIYESWEFSNQFIYTKGRGYGGRYPDPEISVFPWDMNDSDLVINPPIPNGNSDWTYYEGPLHAVPNDNVFGATPAFVSQDNTGKAYFDDFVVNEYDANGQLVGQLLHAQVDRQPSDWYFLNSVDPLLSYSDSWSGKKVGSGSGTQRIESKGRVGSEAVSISKAKGTYTVQSTKMTVPVKQGHFYQINGWIKGEKIKGKGAMLGFHFKEFKYKKDKHSFTKDYLEKILLEYGVSYFMEHNVPVNVGEFGVSIFAFQNDLGGERLVADFLDLFEKYRVNAQYFNYHGIDYGIYTNLLGFPVPESAIPALVNTFSSKLGGTTQLPLDGAGAGTINQGIPDGTVIPDGALNPSTQPEPPPEASRPKPSGETPSPFSDACTATYTLAIDNSRLDIPCMEAGGQVFSVSMVQRFSPFIFLTELENIQVVPNANLDDNCLARYDATDSSLHMPCIRESTTANIWEAYFFQISPTVLFVVDLPRVQRR